MVPPSLGPRLGREQGYKMSACAYGASIPRAWKFGPGNPGHMPGHIPGNPGHIEPAVREKRSLGGTVSIFPRIAY